MSSNSVQVAIDGPSASGKSTVSREVADQLRFVYVDSGSLYRAITWKASREGVDPHTPSEVVALISRIKVDSRLDNRAVRFTVDGEEPGNELMSQPVVDRVSDIAANPEVRRFVVDRLRETVKFGNLVMEGRDIGTVVFPNAAFKFYLDADPEERAKRRHREMSKNAVAGELTEVRDSLELRDLKDTTRKTAPLQVAPRANVVNTTSMSIDEVAQGIVRNIRAAGVGV